ncbi:MAG: hypothetical protein M3680_07425 [Myxococcota bacterium]|nr:hypothetical protein [Myxococcota bacterium]
MSVPPKPAPPSSAVGTTNQLISKSIASPSVYRDFLARDASLAAVPVPTIQEMSRKLAFRGDDARHVLEVGAPAIDAAGLRIAAVRANNTIAIEIQNTTKSELAYFIKSAPTPNISGCNAARPLPLNVNVIEKGAKETRVECVWRAGMAIAVTHVETVELSPLSAYYMRRVPPALLGVDDRVSRGHVAPGPTGERAENCAAMVSQAVRTGLENGEIGWRDLADFYSRHRCQTYSFPLSYRAFTQDNQRAIPAASGGM